MYIINIKIENIRSIKRLEWSVGNPPAGWHVVIGDNGAGKSTFLRAVSLALLGREESSALREDWRTWLASEAVKGSSRVDLRYGNLLFSGSVVFKREGDEVLINEGESNVNYIRSGNPGLFSAAYGPFRRFEGGDKDHERLFYSNPRLAAHLSVFGEDIALTECLRWLQDLQFKKLEKNPEAAILDQIITFVNQDGFLPHGAKLKQISSRGVDFVDGNGNQMPVEELSDGYRSILSMTFELIRQLVRVYPNFPVFDQKNQHILVPGVVLIDEVDAHLHPTWQRQIGAWFKKCFPKMQFIVTTHSPLVCQAATTVFRLPKPGTDEEGRMITGTELDRLRYGNVLDAYGTELFGENVTRSDEAQKMLARLAELNQKEIHEGLSDSEKAEQTKLRAAMPTSAGAIDAE